MRLDALINNVIRLRAFTNMRLLPQEVIARKRYEELADKLLEELTPGEQRLNWQFTTTLTAQVLMREEDDVLGESLRNLMLHVLRDTLGRRWKRRTEHAYNRNSLWRMLFTNTWERLNSDGISTKPCGALDADVSRNVLGIYAYAPFAGADEGAACAASKCGGQDHAVCLSSTWSDLAGSVETHDPFCVHFTGRRSRQETNDAQAVEEIPFYAVNHTIHPHIHTINISADDEARLLSVPSIVDKSSDTAAWDACTSLRTGDLRILVGRARQLGVVPFHDRDAQTRFLCGLSKIARCKASAVVYMFPYRADFKVVDATRTLGMSLCCEAPLAPWACEFLWTINDTLFNEYLEDVLADMELHFHEEASGAQDPATAVVAQRQPVPSERWAKAPAPAVLIVVSTKLELETLIDLAGIKSSLDPRRRRIGNSGVWRHELPSAPSSMLSHRYPTNLTRLLCRGLRLVYRNASSVSGTYLYPIAFASMRCRN